MDAKALHKKTDDKKQAQKSLTMQGFQSIIDHNHQLGNIKWGVVAISKDDSNIIIVCCKMTLVFLKKSKRERPQMAFYGKSMEVAKYCSNLREDSIGSRIK